MSSVIFPRLNNRRHPIALLGCAIAAVALQWTTPTPVAHARQPAPPTNLSDWPMFGRDAGRSNVAAAATGIDSGTIARLQRQQVRLDGTVDASPIYLRAVQVKGGAHDALFVTTTYGKTMAVDANDGSILWEYTPPNYASWAGSYRITTATPVADPERNFIYAASPDGHIQKLSVSDGHAEWSISVTKLPEREKIAAALNFFRGRVIAATGGYVGDRPPYQGHVTLIDGSGGKVLHVWNALCSDQAAIIEPRSCPESGAAIWGRAGVTVDTESGHLFLATGNGKWDGRRYWGDSVIVLDADTRLVGNYTPQNTDQLSAEDRDLGSTSPALLGGGLLAQGGKDGHIRLLNVAQIGGTAPHRGGETQTVANPAESDLFTALAVRRAEGQTWLFAADNGATAAWVLRAGRLQQAWRVAQPGTSPILAGGLLYVYSPRGGLHIYQPDSGRELTTLECGEGHWNSPIVVDGKIVLPEGSGNAHRTDGVLDIWRVAKGR